MTNRITLSLAALLLLLGGPLSSAAQAQTGSIHGTVADPSGAVVPSASITLTSSGGASTFALSGGDGGFVIDSLEPGSYTISVSAEGFAPFDPFPVQVVAGKSTLKNVALSLPVETQSVTVSDQGMSVDTSAAQQRKLSCHQGKRSRCPLRRSRRTAKRAHCPRRPRRRPQRRTNLHRRLHRRTASAQVLHSRDPHQPESLRRAVRQARLWSHRDPHQARHRQAARFVHDERQ